MLPSGQHKSEMLAVLQQVIQLIDGREFGPELQAELNSQFGPVSDTFMALSSLLKAGVEEGWVAYDEVGGADYRRGRIAQPSAETAQLSVESGLLRDVKGQYHCHTFGEINMIIPLEDGAQFCGHGAGWMVFPAMSEHFPTVTGKALMMYFLPHGEIEYRAPRSATA